MKKIIYINVFLLIIILFSNVCYAGNIDKDISVKAKSEYKLEGAVEGEKVSNTQQVAKLDDGTIITANGIFDDAISLMVMPIKKNMKKEWEWLQSVTEELGINKSAYDIFFINTRGEKVDLGAGSQISVMSQDKTTDVSVFYIEPDGEKSRLKAILEEYVVKFKMVKNGYYALLVSNDKLLTEKLNKIENKNKDKNNDNANKNGSEGNSGNKNNTDDGKLDDSSNNEDGDNDDLGDSDIEEKNKDKGQDNNDDDNSVKKDKDEYTEFSGEDDGDWTVFIICFILLTLILFAVILYKRKKKDEKDENEKE